MNPGWRSCSVVALALLVALPASGCRLRGCHDSALQLGAVRSGGAHAVTARLTSHGDPVSGKQVQFLISTSGASGDGGQALGNARTDDDGVARLDLGQSLDSLLLPGDHLTAVRAEFAELGGSEAYCSSKDRRTTGP